MPDAPVGLVRHGIGGALEFGLPSLSRKGSMMVELAISGDFGMRVVAPAITVFFVLAVSGVAHATECQAPPAKNGVDFSLPCSFRNPIPVADQTVFFASRSVELSPETRATLDRQAAILARHPNIRIEIVAFADDVEAPTPSEKLALGAKRAQAIGAYLIAKGIPALAITTKGRETNVLIPKKLDAPTLALMRQAFTDAK